MGTTFILGASDMEMALIENLLRRHGHATAYALINGQRVTPSTAYQATEVSAPFDPLHAVWIECESPGTARSIIIDHHQEGDPGYTCPPDRYWDGSSLGQVCKLIGIPPSRKLRIAAAADHCLSAAYRGACPGVDPQALRDWRLASRASSQRISISRIMRNLQEALDIIPQLGHIEVEGHTFRDALDINHTELAEASAILGEPIMYSLRDRRTGAVKVGALNGTADSLKTWMHHAPTLFGLERVYGNPVRGYAGGYLPQSIARLAGAISK